METKPEYYIEHEGTVRVSGSTLPKKAAGCAYAYLQNGFENIEFFFIGANAGHQATKAMTIFSFTVRNELQDSGTIAFEPRRVMVQTRERGGKTIDKDATVWRVIIVKK
jgi:stage V sporulation protein SpoVS